MVSKSRNKISPEIKSQVLSELQVPGCIVSNLAKSYNVSNTTIYTWQQKARKISVDNSSEVDRRKHKYFVSFKLLFDMLLKCIFPSLVANRY